MLAMIATVALGAQGFPREAFEKHIRFLASDDLKGRKLGTPEGREAAQYVADRFKELGLLPSGKEGYFHPFVSGTLAGRNVAGRLEGLKPGEYVVVAAHHDGRGVVGGAIQPGADDNASGVAMLLELARSLAGQKFDRSILFISFDGEEEGLAGSRQWVKEGIWPLEACAAIFVFDLVGGNFLPWEKGRLYALGSESSVALHDGLSPSAGDPAGLDVVRSAVSVIEPVPGMARSDYHEFRNRGVPFVFFSTGTPWYYHTAHDTVDVINYEKMSNIAAYLRRVILETAQGARRPVFQRGHAGPEDVVALRAQLSSLLDHRDEIKVTPEQLSAIGKCLEELKNSKPPLLPELQQGMALVFTIARAQGAK